MELYLAYNKCLKLLFILESKGFTYSGTYSARAQVMPFLGIEMSSNRNECFQNFVSKKKTNKNMPKAQTETGANSTKHLVLTDRYMKAE